jgi:hypothetical protein
MPRKSPYTIKLTRKERSELMERSRQGAVLGPRDYVLCTDEKTSIQARRRTHRSLPPVPGRPAYVEHEYARKGAWAYLAASILYSKRWSTAA